MTTNTQPAPAGFLILGANMTNPIHPLAGTADEVRAFEAAAAPAAVAVPDSSNLGFAIEQRGDVWVVVEDSGGVCPASSHECALWNALIEARAALAAAPAAPVVLPEPVAWAISYDGKTPYSLWTEGDGALLDTEIKRLGGTARKMPLYAAPAADALDAADHECLAMGRAMNRAALELPADGEIRIDIENGAGAVYVLEPKHGDWRYIDSGDVFSAQINAAIDAAIAAQAAAQGGA